MAIELKADPDCCEEAARLPFDFYVPCNLPAVSVLYSDKDKREYRMCKMCAFHNIKNRGMIYMRQYEKEKQ